MSRSLCLTLSLALSAAPLGAVELERAHVAADARWVGHFDVQAFQQTTLWQRMSQQEEIALELASGLEEVRQELGLDPLRDVLSVTVYGHGDEEDGIVLLETTGAVDHAIERFSQEPDYRHLSHRGLDVHSWSDEGFVHVVSRADGRRLVLIAPDPDKLVEGVRVVEGQSPSLAANPAPRVTARPMAGSFAFLAAADGIPGLGEIDPASQVASLATGLVLDVGESAGELFARAAVRTADVQGALDLADVFDGLVALGRLALSSQELPPEVPAVLRALHVEARGNEVWVEFRYGVDRLLELLELLDQDGD